MVKCWMGCEEAEAAQVFRYGGEAYRTEMPNTANVTTVTSCLSEQKSFHGLCSEAPLHIVAREDRNHLISVLVMVEAVDRHLSFDPCSRSRRF